MRIFMILCLLVAGCTNEAVDEDVCAPAGTYTLSFTKRFDFTGHEYCPDLAIMDVGYRMGVSTAAWGCTEGSDITLGDTRLLVLRLETAYDDANEDYLEVTMATLYIDDAVCQYEGDVLGDTRDN